MPDLKRSKTTYEEKPDKLVVQKPSLSKQEAYNNKQLVSFVSVSKNPLTRKNLKDRLIFWNEEQTDDYKYSQYLE